MSLIPGGGTKILQAKKNLNNGSNSRFLLLLPCGHVNLSSSFTSQPRLHIWLSYLHEKRTPLELELFPVFQIPFKQIIFTSVLVSALLSKRLVCLQEEGEQFTPFLLARLDPFVLWTGTSIKRIQICFFPIDKKEVESCPTFQPNAERQRNPECLKQLK